MASAYGAVVGDKARLFAVVGNNAEDAGPDVAGAA